MLDENYPKKTLHDGFSFHFENDPGDTEAEIRARFWRIRENDVVMDIGSREGIYALEALARGAAFVWAFDPNRETCQHLRRNIHVNKWYERCSVHCLALWSRSRDMKYSVEEMIVSENQGDPVKAISLDEFIKNLSIPPSRLNWMKMDVEGAEVEILLGAAATLLKYKPNLLIEVHNVVHGKKTDNLEKIKALLDELGFQPEIVEEGNSDKDTYHVLIKLTRKKI